MIYLQCALARPFFRREEMYRLKTLVAWAGLLNLSKVSAIFSALVVPQLCSAQSFRLRRAVWTGQIVPHSRTSGSCINFLNLRLSNWLLTGWGLGGYHEVCQTCRRVEARPRGLCLHTLVTTETSFYSSLGESLRKCSLSAVVNGAKCQHIVLMVP